MELGYMLVEFNLEMLKNLQKNITTFIFQDQYDQIAAHTQKGIDFLDKYGHFVDARSKIEAEYASKLR